MQPILYMYILSKLNIKMADVNDEHNQAAITGGHHDRRFYP